MSLLKRWFATRRPRFHPDAFTLTEERKYQTLRDWIQKLTGEGQQVMVVCHFQSTFLEIQRRLDDQDLDYRVLAEPVSEQQLLAMLIRERLRREELILTMAPMLSVTGPVDPARPDPGFPLALIIPERYPLLANDRQLEQYVRNLSADAALGYLLSFEDPVIRHFLGPDFIQLMEHLGLGSNDLVSSWMTRRVLERALRRASSQLTHETPAASPLEWLSQNPAAAAAANHDG